MAGSQPFTLARRTRPYHPELRQAIARGREEADAKIADRLFNRAMGYDHEEVYTEENAAGEIVSVRRTRRYHPPDTNAMSQWQRNRHPNNGGTGQTCS